MALKLTGKLRLSPPSNMIFPVTLHGESIFNAQQVKAGDRSWYIPTEVPIAFVYNRRNYAMMMGTPDSLTDFAVGFSLTEEVVRDETEIKSLDIHQSTKGVDLRFKISGEALERLDITQRRRNMIGSASCGLCGLENADTLFRKLPPVSDQPISLDDKAMAKAMTALHDHQPLNQKTHSVHAAAWVNHDGDLKLIREDVGRHNALDKLLGAMALLKMDMTTGFVLMSSRCSYEIVEKAARRGVKAVLSISGPTSFALQKAKEANLAIYSRDGHKAVRVL